MRTNFRNHKNALALSVDRFGGNLIQPAVTVHLLSINQAHAKLDSQTQCRDFPGTSALALPMPHVPCPSTGTRLLSDNATVLISIQFASGKRESGKDVGSRG